jgi:uridine kinase
VFQTTTQQNPIRSFIIAISGIPGSGKTTLARSVADALGDAVVLHFDDYKPVAQYPTDMTNPAGLANWVKEGKNLDAWKIPQLLDDLKALRNGQAISLPANQGEIEPARFIVLEEPSGRARAGLQDLIDMVVLLDLPLEIGLARQIVDYMSYCLKKLSGDELIKAMKRFIDRYEHYPLVREYYLAVLEGARRDFDVVLDGTRPTDELTQEIVIAVKSMVPGD